MPPLRRDLRGFFVVGGGAATGRNVHSKPRLVHRSHGEKPVHLTFMRTHMSHATGTLRLTWYVTPLMTVVSEPVGGVDEDGDGDGDDEDANADVGAKAEEAVGGKPNSTCVNGLVATTEYDAIVGASVSVVVLVSLEERKWRPCPGAAVAVPAVTWSCSWW